MVNVRCYFKAGFSFLLVLFYFTTWSQQLIEDKLIQQYEESKTDSIKIIRLGQLSEYYYAIKNFPKGDSVIEKQINLAEASLNPNLILSAYFKNAGFNSSGTSTLGQYEITKQYIERAIEYAKAKNFTDYVAIGYANLSSLNNTQGLTDKAFKNANNGFTTALNTSNDSSKVVCAIELGNIYIQRSDLLSAFKTFTTALNIATEHKEESLKPLVYNAIANMYKKLGKNELAKSYVNRSRAVNEKLKHIPGLITDYIFLAKLSNYIAAKQHLQTAIEYAEKIESIPLKIEAEKILFSYMLLTEHPSYMNKYLDSRTELKNLFINTGPEYISWMRAEIYLYGGLTDSALYYFRKAEASFNTGYDLTSKKNFFSEFAYCLQQTKNTGEAIVYYKKAQELARAASDLNSLKSNSKQLKNLYEQEGNYQLALQYSNLYDSYKDSVDLLGKEKDLAVMEIENETAEQERQKEIAAAALERKYNLQYMFITIVVVTVFVLLIMVGMFKVSAFTIRLMGFLSLIFLFEFIILYLDQKIHHMTHGEPWKIWLIKICIISFLLPLHHFLEHKLIRYLLSRHLITLRSKISLTRLFKKKKPLPESENEEEA